MVRDAALYSDDIFPFRLDRTESRKKASKEAFLFCKKYFFFNKRNDIMHDHSETEHKNYRVHIKGYCVCPIKDIENSVISEIYDKRIHGGIARFAESDKDIVDYNAACVCYVKRHEFYDYIENFGGIFKILNIGKERRP